MTIETVNKFRVITGRKTPLTRYHKAIQILQCCVANNTSTHTKHTQTVDYFHTSYNVDYYYYYYYCSVLNHFLKRIKPPRLSSNQIMA